jgi:hypothetical protein
MMTSSTYDGIRLSTHGRFNASFKVGITTLIEAAGSEVPWAEAVGALPLEGSNCPMDIAFTPVRSAARMWNTCWEAHGGRLCTVAGKGGLDCSRPHLDFARRLHAPGQEHVRMSMGPDPLQHRYTQAWLCCGRFGQVPSDEAGTNSITSK